MKDISLNDLILLNSKKGINLDLERIKKALHLIGDPCKLIPAIQIVGTNGKGSIASFLSSILKVSGIKAGITTSPHLISWRERINVNGELITNEQFKKYLLSINQISQQSELTPFELVIALALYHFAKQNIDLIVLEAGLGGRLDATTAHQWRPIIAISEIGIDHCEYLGDTLDEIAKEKVAVITSGSTVISAQQHPIIKNIIENKAKKEEAKLIWTKPIAEDWKLGLLGDFQRRNAAVAKGVAEALEPLGFLVSEQQIKLGLELAHWPGRLQRASWRGKPVLIDGAHNKHAAEQLAEERNLWEGNGSRIDWILGIQSHKKAPEMLNLLLKSEDVAWIVPIAGHQAWSASDICDGCRRLHGKLKQANSVEEVLIEVSKRKEWPNPCPVIAGSLYLIGDLLGEGIISTD